MNQHKKKNEAVQQIKMTKQVKLIGDSMLPTLDPNDISMLFVTENIDYVVGDIVVFKCEESILGFSVHRIIHLTKDKVITKGDNNLQADNEVDKTAIIGRIEKAFYNDKSFRNVKSSKLIAYLSKFESRTAKVPPQKIVVFMHRILVKVYGGFK